MEEDLSMEQVHQGGTTEVHSARDLLDQLDAGDMTLALFAITHLDCGHIKVCMSRFVKFKFQLWAQRL